MCIHQLTDLMMTSYMLAMVADASKNISNGVVKDASPMQELETLLQQRGVDLPPLRTA